MSDHNVITVRGRVGTDPVKVLTTSGRTLARFRLGSTRSYRDADGTWHDEPTEWFTVKVWGQPADNVCRSLTKGVPVVVQGRLAAEEWRGEDATFHSNIITASIVGIDLKYGEARYTKVVREAAADVAGTDDGEPADDDGQPADGQQADSPGDALPPVPDDAWEKVG